MTNRLASRQPPSSADQRALDTVIRVTLKRLPDPIPPHVLRGVLHGAGDWQAASEALTGLYRSCSGDELNQLLVHALFTVDVLGYWVADRRIDTSDWDISKPGRRSGRKANARANQATPAGPLPFGEALAWARAVSLPVAYYGERIALAHSMADTAAGLLRLDQIQLVCDSGAEANASGIGFADWRAGLVAAADDQLRLPAGYQARMVQNLLQGHYGSGRCEQFRRWQAEYPYLVYVATNDDQQSADHEAMHGFVARHDHPAWRRWRPPCADGCRCRLISLTRADAEVHRADDRRRLRADHDAALARARALRQGPDADWQIDLCADPTAALRAELDRRLARLPPEAGAEPVVDAPRPAVAPELGKLATPPPFSDAERDVLKVIEQHLHQLIRTRCAEFGIPTPTELQVLGAARPASPSEWQGINIRGMYGGFSWWFEGTGAELRLITESGSRVVGWSGRRHEVSAHGVRLLETLWG